MKTYFKDLLRRVRELEIDILDTEIANEVEFSCDEELSEEEFEQVCSLVREVYLKSESLTILDIVYALNGMMEEGKKVSDITIRELREQAAMY